MRRETIILAIETSGRGGSVAIGSGAALLAESPLAADRRSASDLFPTIERLLCDCGLRLADVNVFAFSQGPGSFTGLRLAATAGRILQFAIGCDVVAVPTLEVIAQNALTVIHPPADQILAIASARNGRVYAARFACEPHAGLRSVQVTAELDFAEAVRGAGGPFLITGDAVAANRTACEESGAQLAPPELWSPTAQGVLARSAERILRGEFTAPAAILPLYLRPPECEEVYEQRRAAAKARRQ